LIPVLVDPREFILELARKRLAADARDFEHQVPRRIRQRHLGRQFFRQIDSFRRDQTPDLQSRLDLTRTMTGGPATRAYPDFSVFPWSQRENLLRGQSLLGVEARPNALIGKQFDQTGVLRGDPDDFARVVVLCRLARQEQRPNVDVRLDLAYRITFAQV